jgi:hypothetical protein
LVLEGVVIAVSGAFNDYLLADRVMARGQFRKCLRRLAIAEKVMLNLISDRETG